MKEEIKLKQAFPRIKPLTLYLLWLFLTSTQSVDIDAVEIIFFIKSLSPRFSAAKRHLKLIKPYYKPNFNTIHCIYKRTYSQQSQYNSSFAK